MKKLQLLAKNCFRICRQARFQNDETVQRRFRQHALALHRTIKQMVLRQKLHSWQQIGNEQIQPLSTILATPSSLTLPFPKSPSHSFFRGRLPTDRTPLRLDHRSIDYTP